MIFQRYSRFIGASLFGGQAWRGAHSTPTAGVTCTIDGDSFDIMGLKVTERTGGEASPLSFRITLTAYLANEFARGSSVYVKFIHADLQRSWTATVESVKSKGAEVEVLCLLNDATLGRLVVRSDYISQDWGVTLKAMVDDYGGSLTSTNMDTSLGVTAPISGQYKTLLQHLREVAQVLGLMLWVDNDGDVHLVYPADLSAPDYLLFEDY